MYLGLDISTSVVGATIIDEEGKILLCEAWNFKNKKKFPHDFTKILQAEKNLQSIFKKYKIEKCFIEEPLLGFARGHSSSKVLMKLGKFNGVISWIVFNLMDEVPNYIPPTTARKLVGLKVRRGEDTKKQILNFVVDTVPEFVVEYTRFGNPKQECYDMADSYVVAKAGLEQCQQSKS